KEVKLVTQAKAWEIREYTWSPDSKWVAYARPEEEGLGKVWVYSVETGKSAEATDGWYASGQPCLSGDGKYRFFVSNRDFNPLYSRTEWNHAYQDLARVYLVTLAKDTESPFKPKSDEVTTAAKPEPKGKDEPKKEPAAIKVDLDGLKDRVLQ